MSSRRDTCGAHFERLLGTEGQNSICVPVPFQQLNSGDFMPHFVFSCMGSGAMKTGLSFHGFSGRL